MQEFLHPVHSLSNINHRTKKEEIVTQGRKSEVKDKINVKIREKEKRD
jgi:hypothetical protein